MSRWAEHGYLHDADDVRQLAKQAGKPPKVVEQVGGGAVQ